MFRLAKAVLTTSAKFVLTGGDQVAMGIEVIGMTKDDKPITTISDKAVNPAVTCNASEGTCANGLTAKMEGEGWSCAGGVKCSFEVVLGSEMEIHSFSILQRQTAPLSLVSKYAVSINGVAVDHKMDPKQAANRQTFRLATPVSSAAVTFQVKSLSGSDKAAPLGGHFAIYGHAKPEEEKKEKAEVNESSVAT